MRKFKIRNKKRTESPYEADGYIFQYLILGLSVGLGLGICVGLVMGNLSFGMSIGMSIGIVAGYTIGQHNSNNRSQLTYIDKGKRLFRNRS